MTTQAGFIENLRASLGANLRIVWAITAKDIVDALKNKTTLSVLISLLFIVLLYWALPILESGDEINVLIYDADQSSLLVALENSPGSIVKPYTYSSQEKMEYFLRQGDAPELGLVIPADFDQAVASGSVPALQGYVLHWVSASDAGRLRRSVEAHIAAQLGAPVDIRLNTIYLQPDSHGLGVSASMAMAFMAIMVGISLIPNLMLEEKQAKTMEVLLVSPASAGQVAAAKALTGMFYCLLGLGLAFVLYHALIVQWGLAILAALCGALLTAAIGLVLGTLVDTRQQLVIWAWASVIPLVLPLILSLEPDLFPAWLVGVSRWIPTTALFNVLRVSFSDQARPGLFGPQLALVLACAGLLLAIVAWRVRRSDR
jgi:ABC-2 type transport system permease protein